MLVAMDLSDTWPMDGVNGDSPGPQLRPHVLFAPWALMTASQVSLTSLKFSNKAMERAYSDATARFSHIPLDATICFHKAWISLVLVACILVGAMEATAVGTALWGFYISLLSGHYALMKLAPDLYRQHRRWLIIPIKLCLAATLTAFVPTFVLKQAHSTAAYIEMLLLGAGLVMQLCTGVCMPVLWRHHVPMALGTFCLYNLTMLQPLADVLMCSSVAIHNTSVIYNTLDNAAFTLGNLVMPYPVHRPISASPRAQAYIVVLWLQLHLALLVPAVYLYVVESRSRVHFLQQWQQQQQQQQQQLAEVPGNRTGAASSSQGVVPGPDAQPSTPADLCHNSPPVASGVDLPGSSHSQPVVLLTAFMLLMCLLSWNLLHLCVNLAMPAPDKGGPYGFVARVAAMHGLAGSCFP